MKTISYFCILLILLLIAAPIYATASEPSFDLDTHYLDSTQKLPKNLSVTELIDSLSSPDNYIKISAINQLAALKDTSCIPALIDVYKKAPVKSNDVIDGGPDIKDLVILTLGNLGGSDAYNFLKQELNELLRNQREIEKSGGNTWEIFCGLFSALAKLEPADSSYKYKEIFDDANFKTYLREFAYQAYERIALKDRKFATLQDSLFYLLDKSKATDASVIRDSNNQETPEFIKKYSLETLILVYAFHHIDLIDKYREGLPKGDSYVKEVDYLKTLIKSRMPK